MLHLVRSEESVHTHTHTHTHTYIYIYIYIYRIAYIGNYQLFAYAISLILTTPYLQNIRNYIRTHTHIYICVYVCTCIYIYIYIYVCVCVCECVCICVCICVWLQKRTIVSGQIRIFFLSVIVLNYNFSNSFFKKFIFYIKTNKEKWTGSVACILVEWELSFWFPSVFNWPLYDRWYHWNLLQNSSFGRYISCIGGVYMYIYIYIYIYISW